jgi:hypothetical protein
MGLKDDMITDLAGAFFAPADFSVAATITPLTGTPYSINGDFDDAYQAVDPNNGTVISSVTPVFKTAVSFLLAPLVRGDQITIDGITYKIRDQQPDGVGIVDIFLTEVDGA